MSRVRSELSDETISRLRLGQKLRWQDTPPEKRSALGKKIGAHHRRRKQHRDDPQWVADVAAIAAMLKLKCPRGGQK